MWKDGFGQVQKAWGAGPQRWEQQFQSQEEMDLPATGRLEFWRQGAVWGPVERGGFAKWQSYKRAEWIKRALSWFDKEEESYDEQEYG